MNVKILFSKALLMNRGFLWLLFLINLGGTIYGYMWYEYQLKWTIENFPLWLLPFVPDSPTSSLFFTISVLFFLFPPSPNSKPMKWFRGIIDALGVVCSIKYGVWATAIIIAGALQGGELNWQSYMLMTSHLAMAVEVLLYVRFMKVFKAAFVIAAGWLLLNDTLDYSYGIYPFLPAELKNQVSIVCWSTVALSICSIWLGYFVWKKSKVE